MELRQLEMLLAVADTGSYLRAGERLHVSHSAVHRQIRLLEREMHDRLFARSGKRVHLTDTGRIVVSTARRILQEVAAVKRQVLDLNQLQGGHLRIGTGTTVLQFVLPPILTRFRRRFPKVELHVRTGAGDHIVQAIAAGQLDLGIVYSPLELASAEPLLDFELLYREEFVPAVGKGDPLAKRRSVTLAELARAPLILFPPTSRIRRMIEAIFEKEGLARNVVMELENEEVMEKMIAINMGVAFLSKRRAVRSKIRHLRITDRPVFCEVELVRRKMDYLPSAAAEFVRMLRSAVGKAGDAD